MARYLPPPASPDPADLDVPDGATAAEVIGILGLPPQHVALIAVNGRRADRDRVLREGDQVTLFPPVAGGAPDRGSMA